jgi:uncharacterized membrane protein YdjX (TVP38/TMEM64 family)
MTRRARLATLLAALAAGLLLWLLGQDLVLDVLHWTARQGAWGPVWLVALYPIAGLALVPGALLSIGAGFLFGAGPGLAGAAIGTQLGAAFIFFLARTAARDWAACRIAKSRGFRALDEAVAGDALKIVFLTRLSPVLPFNVLNVAYGLSRVPARTFLLGTLLGTLPVTVVHIWIGTTARSFALIAAGEAEGGAASVALLGAGLAATVAAGVIVARAARRALQGANVSASASEITPTPGDVRAGSPSSEHP